MKTTMNRAEQQLNDALRYDEQEADRRGGLAAVRRARAGHGATIGRRRSTVATRVRCADCGEEGASTGHMECQYPQNH